MYSVAFEKLVPPMSTVAGLCSQHCTLKRHTQGGLLLVMTAAPVPRNTQRETILTLCC